MPPYEVAFLEPNKFHATILDSLASSCRGHQHFCWEDSGHAPEQALLFLTPSANSGDCNAVG